LIKGFSILVFIAVLSNFFGTIGFQGQIFTVKFENLAIKSKIQKQCPQLTPYHLLHNS